LTGVGHARYVDALFGTGVEQLVAFEVAAMVRGVVVLSTERGSLFEDQDTGRRAGRECEFVRDRRAAGAAPNHDDVELLCHPFLPQPK
jgi:hypothetical protein